MDYKKVFEECLKKNEFSSFFALHWWPESTFIIFGPEGLTAENKGYIPYLQPLASDGNVVGEPSSSPHCRSSWDDVHSRSSPRGSGKQGAIEASRDCAGNSGDAHSDSLPADEDGLLPFSQPIEFDVSTPGPSGKIRERRKSFIEPFDDSSSSGSTDISGKWADQRYIPNSKGKAESDGSSVEGEEEEEDEQKVGDDYYEDVDFDSTAPSQVRRRVPSPGTPPPPIEHSGPAEALSIGDLGVEAVRWLSIRYNLKRVLKFRQINVFDGEWIREWIDVRWFKNDKPTKFGIVLTRV